MTETIIKGEVFLSVSLYDQEICSEIEKSLRCNFPVWFSSVHLDRDGFDEMKPIGSQSLYAAWKERAPARFRLSSAVLRSQEEKLVVFLSADESSKFLNANRISFELPMRSEKEALELEQLRKFFLQLCSIRGAQYGNARSEAEFNHKNMKEKDGALRVFGRNLEKELPGLYWLNYFGEKYCAEFGEGAIAALPPGLVHHTNDGFFIQIGERPHDWDLESSRAQERLVRSTLGEEYFFNPKYGTR